VDGDRVYFLDRVRIDEAGAPGNILTHLKEDRTKQFLSQKM
jgi:ABC-type polar amino acid transport system ATPase subunit